MLSRVAIDTCDFPMDLVLSTRNGWSVTTTCLRTGAKNRIGSVPRRASCNSQIRVFSTIHLVREDSVLAQARYPYRAQLPTIRGGIVGNGFGTNNRSGITGEFRFQTRSRFTNLPADSKEKRSSNLSLTSLSSPPTYFFVLSTPC